MKLKQLIFIAFVVILSSAFVFAQRPPRGNGPPRGDGPPRQPGQIGQPRVPRGEKPPMGDRDQNQRPDLIKSFDTNKNQKIEFEEFQTSPDRALNDILSRFQIVFAQAAIKRRRRNTEKFGCFAAMPTCFFECADDLLFFDIT